MSTSRSVESRIGISRGLVATGLILCAVAGVGPARAQTGDDGATNGPWYSTPLPPGLGEVPAVVVGPRGPVPVIPPPGDPNTPELSAASMWRDLETIIGFAHESRSSREIGSGQLWGRVTGFPSSRRTIEWAAEQFRRAGIADVEVQRFNQAEDASMWLPLSWRVTLLADPAFGPGTRDVVLESATPLNPSDIPGGVMTAPIVYVGTASPAVLDHIDVRGRIAVQQITPQGHMVFERGAAVGRARDLFERGAVAVFNVLKLPGNELAWDLSNCGGPCFNIGGRDGTFLESVIDAAAAAGTLDRLSARLELQTDRFTGMTGENAVAVIPGRSDETIIINAHADSWFDGSGDNGDGLAVTIAVARHFARPENRPERTLVFVASAGHHSAGMNGPRNFVEMNPDLADRGVLVINVEHVAQRNFAPSRTVASDGYRETVADVREAPIVAGVANGSPFLDGLFAQGVERYGVNFISANSTMSSGETGGYSGLSAARVTVMQAPPLYHTSGEGLEVISAPGMERIARFFVYMLNEAGAAPRSAIVP